MKVLIISHTPVSTQNNMGKTFCAMFSSFAKEELCQLYIYPSYPDAAYCSSFYRVTDKDILKHLKPGNEVKNEDIKSGNKLYENQDDEGVYRNIKNKNPLRRLLRDFIWTCGNWYNHKLKNWLDREKPTCIFLAPGSAKFIYRIAMKIAKARNIPIITYVCDEYYFVKPETTLMGKLRLKLLKNTMEKTMRRTTHLIAISEEIKELYSVHFGVKSTLLMTGSQRIGVKEHRSAQPITGMSYFGNIRLNRYLSLADIGKALDRINEARGTDYKLKIYTGEKDPIFLSVFESISSVVLNGFLSGEEFEKAMDETQVLVHVEAFDEDSVDRVRHSISTKIADALSGGIPLFAYGPDNVSSIRHLLRNECAVVVTSEEMLESSLLELFGDASLGESYVSNALKTARQYHCAKDNSDKLYDLFNQLHFKE